MTSNDDSFRSLTGSPEFAEPAASTPSTSQAPMASSQDPAPQSSTNRTRPSPSTSASDSTIISSARQQALNGSRSLNVSGSPSTANSPQSSRDTSPARPPHRQQGSSGALPKSGLRSRKSSTDVSPNRGPSLAGSSATVPSAAAIQRALSSAAIPQLPPASTQDPSRVPRPLKSTSGNSSGDTTPHWPISPRLKSPPPNADARSRSRRNSLRTQSKKAESSSTPAIVVQSSSPAPASRIPVKDEGGNSDPDEQPLSMKAASRGASGVAPKLETVQESSLPSTPGFESLNVESSSYTSHSNKSSDEERNDVTSSKVTEDLSGRATKQSDSGGENATKKPDSKPKMSEQQRSASTQRPSVISPKASFSSLSAVKSRAEAPRQNMTVETETVPSIAQATIGNQDRSASGRGEGSLRLKPSNETIRPKKEKPKPKRKAPSINAGTASSKADVFEQKVASAVDEANSSDSDATFIYESNPPEQQPHRSRQHHHSRTPSMTSIASLADPRAAIRDAHKNPGKKSSMKFANPYNNANADNDSVGGGDGTIRMGSGRVSGGSHHHHIGRHGHGRGALSHVLVDSDSSMAQSSRRGPSSRYASQPNSPRFHQLNMGNGSSNGNGNKKHGEYSVYDIDTENAADDERTPLISSIRSPRVRPPRRRNDDNFRQHLDRRHHRNGGWCRRLAGCLVLAILVLVLVFSAVGLVFATTKQLTNVEIHKIENVIASQEELMLDLVVDAINPNIIGVTVGEMEVSLFAKSKHVGSDKWWREHGDHHHNEEEWQPISDESLETSGNEKRVITIDGIDEGTDPIEDGERTMLLGRIFHFDSPLSFDGSFFKRRKVESLGEIRLTHPGNKTETGGTERWEEVLQYPFELIVKGVLKYQLPLSTQEHKTSVSSSYFYDPDTEKKKFKIADSNTNAQKRHLLPQSVKILPTPWGRYARAIAQPDP